MAAGWSLLLVVVLIGLNGLFVAAEFSLVAARRGPLEEAAVQGDARAAAAIAELGRISFVLSACQFGITATSLVVGFLAEDAVGGVVVAPVLGLLGLPEGATATVAVTLAFVLSTVVQMLFGELAPKNLAIARPERVSLATARPIRAFGIVLGPVIRLFDSTAEMLTRRVFRIQVPEELLAGHTPDELVRIIAASTDEGSLTAAQGELLSAAVVLGDRRVHEVMVPRTSVTFLDADDSLEHLRATSRRTGHSRFPVAGEGLDDVVGTVHVKDLLDVPRAEHDRTQVRRIVTPALLVPESETLRRLLRRLRVSARTFGVVIDEYGGVAGIVTVEDVLEELVGEIEDEFDRTRGAVRRVGAERFLLDGTVRVDELVGLGIELPEGEYETVAGFLLDALGRIPAAGASVRHGGWEVVAQRVDGVRIVQVLIRRVDDATAEDEVAAAAEPRS